MTAVETQLTYDPHAKLDVTYRDVEYRAGLMARIYQPAGPGPFPAMVSVHGGAWEGKEWLQNEQLAHRPGRGRPRRHGDPVPHLRWTRRTRQRSRTSTTPSAGSRPTPATSTPARTASAAPAGPAAATRSCSPA